MGLLLQVALCSAYSQRLTRMQLLFEQYRRSMEQLIARLSLADSISGSSSGAMPSGEWAGKQGLQHFTPAACNCSCFLYSRTQHVASHGCPHHPPAGCTTAAVEDLLHSTESALRHRLQAGLVDLTELLRPCCEVPPTMQLGAGAVLPLLQGAQGWAAAAVPPMSLQLGRGQALAQRCPAALLVPTYLHGLNRMLPLCPPYLQPLCSGGGGGPEQGAGAGWGWRE